MTLGSAISGFASRQGAAETYRGGLVFHVCCSYSVSLRAGCQYVEQHGGPWLRAFCFFTELTNLQGFEPEHLLL